MTVRELTASVHPEGDFNGGYLCEDIPVPGDTEVDSCLELVPDAAFLHVNLGNEQSMQSTKGRVEFMYKSQQTLQNLLRKFQGHTDGSASSSSAPFVDPGPLPGMDD